MAVRRRRDGDEGSGRKIRIDGAAMDDQKQTPSRQGLIQARTTLRVYRSSVNRIEEEQRELYERQGRFKVRLLVL
jgi:hypothetical protein